jgi:putative membrane protein
MSQNKVDISIPQKQSAITLVFSLLKVLREMWAIFVVIGLNLFRKKATDFTVYYYVFGGIILLFLIKLNTVLSYFTTRFYINEVKELVHTTGLFERKKTVIALHNIQSMQASQNILNRITNTFKVAVQTAGTSKAEIELFAIQKVQLEALQTALASYTNKQPNEAIENQKQEEQYNLSLNGLLKLCISENHLQSFFIIAAFLLGKLNEFKEYISIDATGWLEKKINAMSSGISMFIVFFIFCMMIAILYSCIRIIIKYANFSIKHSNTHLHLNWGLLSTQRKIIAFKKIQTIEWKSNSIRRLLNLAICNIVALGEDIGKKESGISLPITKLEHLESIVLKYNENLFFNDAEALKIHPSYILRSFLLLALPISLLVCLTALFFKKYFVLPFIFLWLIYFLIAKWMFRKRFKFFLNAYGLKIYKGIWGTQEQIIVWENIQNLSISTSPYQRSNSLASLHLYNAGKLISIPYIPLSQANFITNYALYKTETMI